MRIKHITILCALASILTLSGCLGTEASKDKDTIKTEADSITDKLYEAYDAFDFDQAVTLGKEALQLYETLGDTASMSDIMGTMCIAYQRLGNVAEGLKMSQRVIEIDSILGESEYLSSDYNTVAGLYLSEDKAAEAEPFILKAIEYELKTDKQSHLSNRYGIASEIYCKMHKPDTALDYAQKGLAIAEEANDSAQIGARLSQLGDAYMALNKMEDAKQTFLRCADILKATQSAVSLAITYRQLGNIYEDRKQIPEAIAYYEKSADLARKTQYSMLLCQCTQAIGELTAGESPNYSVQMLKESRALADTLHSKKVDELMAGFAAKFDLKEKQHTIEEQAAELKMHRIILGVEITLALMSLLILGLWFYMKRLRRKHDEMEARLSEKVVQETQHHEPEISEADKEFINKLAKYVEANLGDSNLSSTTIADAFCISPRQFSRRVKQLTGIDTTHYIRASRIMRARTLLTQTDLQMQEICYQCGFESANYFSRTFRADVGISPTEYRKKHINLT